MIDDVEFFPNLNDDELFFQNVNEDEEFFQNVNMNGMIHIEEKVLDDMGDHVLCGDLYWCDGGLHEREYLPEGLSHLHDANSDPLDVGCSDAYEEELDLDDMTYYDDYYEDTFSSN